MSDPENPPLTSTDVARYLGISVRKLFDLRRLGDGPPWQQLGRRITYRRRDVDRWIREQTQTGGQPPPPSWPVNGARWSDFGPVEGVGSFTLDDIDDPDRHGGPHQPDPDDFDPNLDR